MPRRGVTWSPVVQPRVRTPVVEYTPQPTAVSMRGRSVAKGELVAHSRRTTHSTLVTIRHGRHRACQLLVSLPDQRIRRVYDGEHSWDVSERGTKNFRLCCRIGDVRWRDDDTLRRADARGFRLDWLDGEHDLRVRQRTRARSSRRA